jgi:WD40 repeat protein
MRTNFLKTVPALLLLVAFNCRAEETKSSPSIFSADGQVIATLAPSGKIGLSKADGTLLRRLDHCAPVSGVFSKDGALFCAAGKCPGGYGALKVWRVGDGKLLCKLDNEMSEIPKLSFSPDGKWLACTAGPSRINLWDVSDGTLKWSASVNRGIASVSFESDGATVIARCADKTARRLSLEKGRPFRAKQSEGTSVCRYIKIATGRFCVTL